MSYELCSCPAIEIPRGDVSETIHEMCANALGRLNISKDKYPFSNTVPSVGDAVQMSASDSIDRLFVPFVASRSTIITIITFKTTGSRTGICRQGNLILHTGTIQIASRVAISGAPDRRINFQDEPINTKGKNQPCV